jgi:hypothetical protein
MHLYPGRELPAHFGALAGENEDKGTTALTTRTDHDAPLAGESIPDDDRILSIEIGGKTVGENLETAIAAGNVIRRPDGKFELAGFPDDPYLHNDGEFTPNCPFLNRFMTYDPNDPAVEGDQT